jgi:tetratricopeptide (TPR) repeat protein
VQSIRYVWVCVAVLVVGVPFVAVTQSPAAPGAKADASSNSGVPSEDPPTTLRALRRSIDTGHADGALQRISVLQAQATPMAGLSKIQGLALYAKGDLRGADKAFAAALREDAADIEAAQMRGLTLFRLGRPAEAIPLLEPSRSSAGQGKADPNYVLGLCYMDTRRYDDARHAFAAQYAFPPDSAAAYLVTARMLLRREYLPVSRTYAQKAIELDASLPLAHELLGEIALVDNHLDEAIAELEKERAHNPLEGSVYDRLGDAYVRAGKYDDARRTLQEAVLLEPNATGPLILLGKAMLKKEDPLGAATYLERANQMDPANFMTHSLLGQAYRAMGRQEDASRETATAQKLQAASEPKLENMH